MKVNDYKNVFDENDGVIKLSDFTSRGYNNKILGQLIKFGYVNKLKTGYYEWIEGEPVSDAVVILKLFPRVQYAQIKHFIYMDTLREHQFNGIQQLVKNKRRVNIKSTIHQCISIEKKMDKEVFNYAIKAYVKESKKNIRNLLDYAEEMNIKNKVSNIIGMWLQ